MKVSELIKLLKKGGCKIVGHGGNHDIWYSSATNQKIIVPRHGSKEIATGTANKILKDAGLK
jgi:predicted RNA binding protein YcfA (HicA-like mRNA interferase family)